MSAPRDQHFLTDTRVVERIARSIDVIGRRVLEIGPGRGVLTRALLSRGATVIAVELDHQLYEELTIEFAGSIASGQLTLVQGNAVKCPIPPFEVVVANLPYSASSKIIFRLLSLGFEEAVLMFQKEFAERMVSSPGSRTFGRLSVMVQTYADVEKLFAVPPSAFKPRPQVSSWVVRLTPREPPCPIADHAFYAEVVRELFSHRRKTVRRALKTAEDTLGREKVAQILRAMDEKVLDSR
ncbi:MAG: 16S rRNA (adenine(1518)-N(6)/adenine(1519)-N(6))-dimethyltransferase RsmA, partial [Methanomicrobiaceae archaeon]|nr:16S rRNA (adenine(1518)-N(6)/adenine(1519)-N(6))-dimethyltransferase RsmA [Methanomicrobiaceae archaeon]